MIKEIILGIFLMSSTTIFFKIFRLLPSKGNWIYEYEDEAWAKVLIIMARVIGFLFGLLILINAIFLSK